MLFGFFLKIYRFDMSEIMFEVTEPPIRRATSREDEIYMFLTQIYRFKYNYIYYNRSRMVIGYVVVDDGAIIVNLEAICVKQKSLNFSYILHFVSTIATFII